VKGGRSGQHKAGVTVFSRGGGRKRRRRIGGGERSGRIGAAVSPRALHTFPHQHFNFAMISQRQD